ncbi:DUF3987 domain-containing protein [Aeromonas allosaccharophila]|uniref:DUF3987 domain-containing protein n=1 Tax=Aeromonas allosaccharophila TaxID=656 RepID=UPI0038CFFC2E
MICEIKIVPPGEFPIESFPAFLQGTAKSIKDISQAHESLIIPLMLSVMAAVCQDLVIVEVNERLKFQVTLYFIVIADSGERKTFVFLITHD